MERFEDIKQFFKKDIKRELPVFETKQETIGQHWILSIPHDIPLIQGQIDLLHILKSLGYQCDAQESDAIALLSKILCQFRRQLIGDPLRCELDSFYFYLLCIKKLSLLFENNHLAFPSLFTDSRNKECGHFLYEYINILLLLVIRIYHAYRYQDGPPSNESIEQMATCKLLLEEVKQSCQESHVSNKWVYNPPVDSIASNDDMKKSRTATIEKERNTLRQYVADDLCGITTLEERIILFDAMKNEHRMRLLYERDRALPIAERHKKTVELIAPIIRSITMTYESITKMLMSRETPSYLLMYTQYKSYYWYVYGEFIMAQSDWSCYALEDHDFIEYAKKAKKRLEVLFEFFAARRRWLQTMPLDDSVMRQHSQLKTEIVTMYDQIKKESIDVRDAAPPDEVKPFLFPPSKITLQSILDDKSKLMSEKNPSIAAALSLLERLSKKEIVINERAFLPPGEPSGQTPSQSNEVKAGILQERQSTLNWLLDAIDERTGEIRLTRETTEFLEREFVKVARVIKENKNF
jgi:hypothetical protein